METRSNALTLRSTSWRGTTLALAFCCGGSLVPASLHALPSPPSPVVEILHEGNNGQLLPGLPPEVLIGEDFHFKLKVSPYPNPGYVGYGPFVELYLQYDGANCNQPLSKHCDGLSFQAAGAEFTTTVLPLTPCQPATPLVFSNPSLPCGPPTPLGTPTCPGTTETPPPSCFFGTTPVCLIDPVAGFQKVVLALPFGSFVSTQPPVLVDVTVHVDSFANDGFPLTVKARGGYQYANSAAGSLPPSIDATCPMAANSTTIPHVLLVHKKYLGLEDETATGPNYPVTYQISVDVANGQTVNNLDVADCLPGNLVYADNLIFAPGSTPSSYSPPPGCLTVFYSSVTGTASHPERSFTFQAFVPEMDTVSGLPVLGPSCKTPVDNQVSATALWTPLDQREAATTVTVQDDHPITAKCIALQKSVREFHDTGVTGPTPGDTLLFTLRFEISDFDTFDGIVLDDYLADGLVPVGVPVLTTVSDKFPTSPLSGQITPAQSVAPVFTCNDGTQMIKPYHLRFDVSSTLATLDSTGRHGLGILTGGRAGLPAGGPATGTITFRAKIADTYLRQGVTPPNVKKDDTLSNCPVISGDLLQNTDAPPPPPPGVIGNGDDDSLAKVTILTGILKKSIYAINGNPPPPPPPLVSPGDNVTFRLTLPIPSSDAAALSFDDFLPLPVFNLTTPTPAVPLTNLCAPGNFGAGTFLPLPPVCFALVSPPPTLMPNLGTNSLHFEYGSLSDPTNTPSSIDMLVTLKATADPYVDGLHLTNHVLESEQSSFGVTFDQTEVAELILGEPKLRIRKGVVAADDPSAIFSPQPPSPSGVFFHPPGSLASPPFTGAPITSTNVGAALNSDVSHVDGCDRLRYVIAVENIGSSPNGAFDVKIADHLPACLQQPSNLKVVNGLGAPLQCVGGCTIPKLFGPGMTLLDSSTTGALTAFSPTSGTNIVIITFDAKLRCNIQDTGCCTNTADLLNYAGVQGGPNHVLAHFSMPFMDTTNPFSDGAQACVEPELSKSIVVTSEPSTTGNQVTIGEVVQYQMQVKLPVGISPGLTLTDNLPAGMVWMPGCTVTAAPQVPPLFFFSGFPPFVSTPFVSNLNINFGTVINPPGGPNGALITVTCNALVLNAAANVAGAVKSNSFTVTLHPPSGPVSFTSSSVSVTIVEPGGSLVKQELPPFPGASPNAVIYQLGYTNTGTSTAFNVHIHDPLPTGLTVPIAINVVPATCTVHSPPPANLVDVTCSQVPPHGTVTVIFTASGLQPCVTANNQATLTYTSLPGLHGTVPNPTGAFPPGLPGAPRGERLYTSAAAVATTRCPDLAIGKTHAGNFTCGGNGTYTLTVTNVGNAASVPPETVTDTLPPGLSFVAGGGGGWTCTAAGAVVTCTNAAAIPPGGSSTLTLTVAAACPPPPPPGSVVNCASVSTQPEINLANNQSCDTTTVVSPPASGCAIAIAGGGSYSVALRNDHTVFTWGSNNYGDLGDGTTISRNTPVVVNGLSNIVAIAAGEDHTLALRGDGTVWAWGHNSLGGALGDGSLFDSSLPIQVKAPGGAGFLGGAVAIAAGAYHSLALLGNGTVLAWGFNGFGQLGNGNTVDSPLPVAVTGLIGVNAIAASGDHSLALLSGGSLRSWGNNAQGQLGNGTNVNSSVPVAAKDPTGTATLSGVKAIAAGNYFSMALLAGGTELAWGLNIVGELGNGTLVNTNLPVPVRNSANSADLSGVAAIAVEMDAGHSLALLTGGTVLAWGLNAYGELGNGTYTDSKLPVAVSGLSSSAPVTALAAGDQHSLALLADGTIRAWGLNNSGQLGNGNTASSNLPVKVLFPCPPCAAPPPGLTGWWPFDEITGPTAADITSGHDNGAYVGTPAPTPGEVGEALCFDGVHDYVDVPAQPQIDFGTGDFTIDLWVRTTTGGVATMVDKRQSSSGLLKGYSFFVDNGRVGLQMADRAGALTCGTSPSAACTNWEAPTGNVADGLWHLIAVTVSRGLTTGGTFFVDGAAVGSFDPTVRSQSLGNASDLWIGATHAVGGSGIGYFSGCLDEVEIANRALQPSEIKAIFAAGKVGKCK